VDEKKLKEVFRLAGRVLDVELNKDKDGKSRGHCVIEFEHPVEDVQAICKDFLNIWAHLYFKILTYIFYCSLSHVK
jgi:hypothetical protein